MAIKAALAEDPEWMQTAFKIALHTGCRLRETRIPMSYVDFAENKITFPSPKGGEARAFSIPMPTALRASSRKAGQGQTEIHRGIPVPSV